MKTTSWAAAVSEANVTLSRDYELLVPVSNGNYTFVAWAGINDNFVKQRFVIGEMTKKDVMITLRFLARNGRCSICCQSIVAR